MTQTLTEKCVDGATDATDRQQRRCITIHRTRHRMNSLTCSHPRLSTHRCFTKPTSGPAVLSCTDYWHLFYDFFFFYYSAAAFICSLKQKMSRREVSACAKGQQRRILCLWYISTLANAVRRQNIYEGRKNSLTFLSCWLFIDGKWCHWPLKELLHYLDMQSGGAEDQSPDWRTTCWTSWARVATIAVWKTCKNHEHRWNTLKADWFFKSINQVMILSKLKAGALV